MDEIIAKLDALRKAYPDQESQEILSDWEKKAKTAVITANLQENDAIKLIIVQYQKEYDGLNKMLQDNESLFMDDAGRALGRLIHERKRWCKKFLSIFTTASSQVVGLKKAVDNFIEQ